MKAITSPDLASLEAIQAKLDAELGYPFEGADIGGGIHAPPEQSRTLRRVDIIKHPSLDQWALPVDQGVAAALAARADAAATATTGGAVKAGGAVLEGWPAPVDVATPLGDALAAADLGPDWDQKAGPVP